MTTIERPAYSAAVRGIEDYIRKYVTLPDAAYSLPLALWTIGTHCFDKFGSYGYLVITSETKRSGKTLLSDLLSFACARPRQFGAMTSATLFHTIENEQPTLFFDEAEKLSSAQADDMRAVLNMGYRRGSTVPRMCAGYMDKSTDPPVWKTVKDFRVYCPKCFILIGDVHDTLTDRAIVVRMRRGAPAARFIYDTVKAQGEAIRKQIEVMIDNMLPTIEDAYATFPQLDFLSGREEDIWLPLCVLCSIICPERYEELQRYAVDLATDKTAPRRRYFTLVESEDAAIDDEFSTRLLSDIHSVLTKHGKPAMPTADLLAGLKALPLAPWRKFRGDGLDDQTMGYLLKRFGIKAANIRLGARKHNVVKRGYKLADIAKVLQRNSHS